MPARKLVIRLVICAITLAVFASCGGDDAAKKAGASDRNKACSEGLPFKFGSLPTGFSKSLEDGPAPGQDGVRTSVAYHIKGPEAKYIEVFRGGARHKYEKGKDPKGRVVRVLGGIARLNKIDGVNVLRIRIARGRCSRYQVEGNGLSEAEMTKIAAGITR